MTFSYPPSHNYNEPDRHNYDEKPGHCLSCAVVLGLSIFVVSIVLGSILLYVIQAWR